MASEIKKEIKLEIGHVLFMDIVGYSNLLINEQRARRETLTQIVRSTETFRESDATGTLIKSPTGDGMALVFRGSPEEPVECALEVSRALKAHPELPLRMGVHSGPVSAVVDVNDTTSVAGAGINMCQRVMDCGDAGHILVSKHVAEDLEDYAHWKDHLHDLGECEVKHGVRVRVTNLYTGELGNPEVPEKFRHAKVKPAQRSSVGWIAAFVLFAIVVAGAYYFTQRPKVAAIPEKSIAVLPFVNMSDDKEQDYFSDGISEEMLNLLAKVPQLKVTARVSSFSFKGKELDIPEIARKLHVADVLEGSVRKAGDHIRISAQLIHAADGFHIWSETYDRKLDDIFKIQDEVAGKVVKELKVTLLEPPPKSRTTDPKVYALYLQGKQLGRQFNAEAYEKSDALLHQALDIDPRYAPAWERLAANFISKAISDIGPRQEEFARAREAVEKALAIDPDYAPAHALLGAIAMNQNDYAGAAKHYERALALDPTDLSVLGNAAIFLADIGRLDEALALQQAIVRRDPVNAAALTNLGIYQRSSGRYDEAIASFRTALSLSPGMGSAHTRLAGALLLEGDAAGALAEIEKETSEDDRMIGLAMAYHALGRKADSDNALAALIAKYEKDDSIDIASVYAFRGEADQAFAWLDKALEYHEGFSGIVTANLFDKIHSDPRWLPFLRKIGNAPDQLAKIKFKMTLPSEK